MNRGISEVESSMSSPVAAAFAENERLLWNLAYRTLGDAAASDDVVQDTFVRALDHKPEADSRPLRPWLVRVAMNLARDQLRRRQRRRRLLEREARQPPWLPSPVPDDQLLPARATPPDIEHELLESARFGFLLAAESLTPNQRAVLLLRDVFDYSVRETADLLSISEGSVKTTLHRARKRLAAARPEYGLHPRNVSEKAQAALVQLLTKIVAQDHAGVEALLRREAIALSEGGEFFAARRPIRGADKVTRSFLGLARKASLPNIDIAGCNGALAVIAQIDGPTRGPRWAPRFVMVVEIDDEGLVSGTYSVLASDKLAGFDFSTVAR